MLYEVPAISIGLNAVLSFVDWEILNLLKPLTKFVGKIIKCYFKDLKGGGFLLRIEIFLFLAHFLGTL